MKRLYTYLYRGEHKELVIFASNVRIACELCGLLCQKKGLDPKAFKLWKQTPTAKVWVEKYHLEGMDPEAVERRQFEILTRSPRGAKGPER